MVYGVDVIGWTDIFSPLAPTVDTSWVLPLILGFLLVIAGYFGIKIMPGIMLKLILGFGVMILGFLVIFGYIDISGIIGG